MERISSLNRGEEELAMSTAGPRPWLRLSLVATCVAGGVAGQYWLSVQPRPTSSAVAWAVAAAAVVGLYVLGRDAANLPVADERRASRRAELALFALVMLVGIFFVCFRIGTIPAGLNHDAAWEGMYAIRILNGEPYTAYTPDAWGRETLTFYLRAGSIWLMGPTMRAIQAPGMVAGILALPFFYWWIRVMFGVRLALVATLFLGASGWHLIFSRTGWRSDFQPFFMALTCCFFARALQRAKRADFFLAGLGLALTLNVYNGARVFPAVFAAWLAVELAQTWDWRGFLHRYGSGLLVMAVTCGVALGPLAWFAIHDWDTFQARAVSLRGASELGDAVRASIGLFNFRGNGDDFFIDDPALELPTAVLFVVGLLWSLLRWRDRRAQILLLALIINLLPGLVSKPNLNRDVGTMIFVYVFVGLGAVFLAQQVRRASGSAGRVASAAMLTLACCAAMAATYSEYLGPHRRPIWGFYPETTVLGRYLKTIVPRYSIWVGGANFPRDALTYLSYQGVGPPRPNYVWLDDIRTLPTAELTPQPGKGLAFVLANQGFGPQVLRKLEARFPHHRVVEIDCPKGSGHVFAEAMLVPADSVTAAEAAAPASVPVPVENASPPGELQQPRGVAVRADGHVFVSDFGNHRIQEFTREGGFVAQWGTFGSGPGQLNQPTGLALGPDGSLAVADTWNGRVQFFDQAGTVKGQTSISLYGPRGVAFAPDGSLYVADTGNSRVLHLRPDGGLLGSLGGPGKGPGEFAGPVGVTVDAEGRVYVADNGNARLQILGKDGRYAGSFPVKGWGSGAFSEPYLAIDGRGRIWVSVPADHEVRAYDRTGALLRTVKPDRTQPDGFETPLGLGYDGGTDQIVVADLAGRIVRLNAGSR